MDTESYDYFLVGDTGISQIGQHDNIVIFAKEDSGLYEREDILDAADNPHAQIVPVDVLLDVSDPLYARAGVDMDELITKYSERLQDIYDTQSAGSHTFVGVLFTMLQELEGR